jgi:hypothetical protein
MEAVVPWQALIALIEPYYPKASKKGGRPPYLLATVLRIHLQQQWYSLSDPAMEEALIEVPTMRRFAGIELISDRIPDATTILTTGIAGMTIDMVILSNQWGRQPRPWRHNVEGWFKLHSASLGWNCPPAAGSSG